MKRQTSKAKRLPTWPPPGTGLPDSIAEIERGKQRQAELFPEPRDDTREGRLRRLTGDCERNTSLLFDTGVVRSAVIGCGRTH
jgi:hypothetical protein